MKGTGRTVFEGGKVEDFQVDVLGVLENIGPRQSLILARLSGGPLAHTGVMQGMSGSPVYVNGKLMGAVAMAFPFSKDPIAGIRPIEDMLAVRNVRATPPVRQAQAALHPLDQDLWKTAPVEEPVLAGGQKLVNIATPLSFSGFTRRTIAQFSEPLRALGLEPQQGISGGAGHAPTPPPPGAPKAKAKASTPPLEPGAMISVQLLSGDMSVGADGTVTAIDGDRVYAFGHRFLAMGDTELPFARAEVLTLLPSISSSFKISAAREWLGAITADRNLAVVGQLGKRVALAPLEIEMVQKGPDGRVLHRNTYRMQMVRDSFLSPVLLQMAVFSAIDATERLVGSSTFSLNGVIEFEGGAPPVRLANMYSGETNAHLQTAISAAIPLAYAMQSGFDALQLKRIALSVESFDTRREMRIVQVWPAKSRVRPGESMLINVLLRGENGAEEVKKVPFSVPIGMQRGTLMFTVSDGTNANLAEYYRFANAQPKSPGDVVGLLNSVRPNTRAYLRVWRPEPAYAIEGRDLPSPPPSAAIIFARDQSAVGGLAAVPNSKLAEVEINAGDVVITGAQTVQVQVTD
jgi:hypothetical protein